MEMDAKFLTMVNDAVVDWKNNQQHDDSQKPVWSGDREKQLRVLVKTLTALEQPKTYHDNAKPESKKPKLSHKATERKGQDDGTETNTKPQTIQELALFCLDNSQEEDLRSQKYFCVFCRKSNHIFLGNEETKAQVMGRIQQCDNNDIMYLLE